MSDCRIIIELDYEPTLDDTSYPIDITTKFEAMEFDMNAWEDGVLGLADLVEFADEVDVKVVKL